MANQNKDYICEVVRASRELSPKERVKIKDTQDAHSITSELAASNGVAIIIDVDYYALLQIHNEKATPNKDYSVVVIVDHNGEKWTTGSESFMPQFEDIMDEMSDLEDNTEPWSLKVYGRPSKNFTGRDFITCSVI